MAIFGNSTGHNTTTLDTTLTYSYSFLLVLSVLIALLLNPVVFFYNTVQRSTLVTRLFQLLALTDTIFLIRPVNALYNLLKPQLDPIYIPDPSLGRKLVCVVTYVTGFSSMFITLILCVFRYVKIRFPFWSLSHDTFLARGVAIVISLDFVWNLSASLYTNFSPNKHYWASATQSVLDVPSDGADIAYLRTVLLIGPFFFKIGLSVVFSLLTLVHLKTDGGNVSDIKKRSIVMILMLNLGNMVWCVVSITVQGVTRFRNAPINSVGNWKYQFYYLQFVESVLMQSLLVAYNPLVICSRNLGIRRMLREMVRHGRLVAPDYPESTGPAEGPVEGVNGDGIFVSLGRSISNASSWSRGKLFGQR